ncbi:MAG: hypothetical protein M3Q23_05045 [Actinomycetota bacterium]|nr:hypothetical protein [Actinomycetota bacterium]
MDGKVRCTATMDTPVQAGHITGLTFALHNVSDGPVQAGLDPFTLWFVLRAGDGTRYDTRVPRESAIGPGYLPETIAPGATKTAHVSDVRVRWAGPLAITPSCQQTTLPSLRTEVAASGPTPDNAAALADVVAASGHLLDHCRPTRAGVPVQGRIEPPSGTTPPMQAACSITLEPQGSFLHAQELVLVPPDLTGVQVKAPYEQITLPDGPGTAEAIAWDFVVTADGAVSASATTVDRTRAANAMAPDWDWTGTRWEGPGGSRCGGSLTSGGGGWRGGAFVEFVSVCPA